MDQSHRKKPFVFRPSPETLKYFKDASPEAKSEIAGILLKNKGMIPDKPE